MASIEAKNFANDADVVNTPINAINICLIRDSDLPSPDEELTLRHSPNLSDSIFVWPLG